MKNYDPRVIIQEVDTRELSDQLGKTLQEYCHEMGSEEVIKVIETQIARIIQDIIYPTSIDTVKIKIKGRMDLEQPDRYLFTITVPRGIYPGFARLEEIFNHLGQDMEVRVDEDVEQIAGGNPEIE